MKKKYRKAIWFAAFIPVYLLAAPFGIVGIVCDRILDRATDYNLWLTCKLKVSKHDPD